MIDMRHVVSTPKKYTPKDVLTCTHGATSSSITGGLFYEALRHIKFSIVVSSGVPLSARVLHAPRVCGGYAHTMEFETTKCMSRAQQCGR